MASGAITTSRGFGIGELSRRTATAVPNIRYYESIGLLPRAGRNGGGQRSYDEADVKRVGSIRNCRDLGFPLREIRALLHLSVLDERNCSEVRDLAARQRDIVRVRIAELQSLETQLSLQVADCDATCCDGPASDCSVFRSLSG